MTWTTAELTKNEGTEAQTEDSGVSVVLRPPCGRVDQPLQLGFSRLVLAAGTVSYSLDLDVNPSSSLCETGITAYAAPRPHITPFKFKSTESSKSSFLWLKDLVTRTISKGEPFYKEILPV